LLAITRNLITLRRRQLHRSRLASRLALLGSDTGDTDVVVDNVDLRRALAALTQEQQDVLILRYFLGKTTHEIAGLMGKQENAIFALQFRAVRSLRRRLTPVETVPILRTEGGGS
jgi:RNA polymerase sigma-70 factor (ECF subfamily)